MTHHTTPTPRWLSRLLHVAHRIFPRPVPKRVYRFPKSGLFVFQIRSTVFKNWVYPIPESGLT